MTIRKWLAAATLCSGLVASDATPTFAADTKPTFGFSTLKKTPDDVAKTKAEAWLKAAGKFDATAFEKVWSTPNRSIVDRVADSLAIGNPEAVAVLAAARDPHGPAPTEVPAFIRDAKDPFFKSNMALAFARGAARKTVVKKMEERNSDGRIDFVVKSVEAPAHEEVLDALNLASPEQVVDPASYFFTKAVAEYALMKKDAATSSVMRLLDDVADLPDRYRLVATLMFFDMTNWSPDPKDLTNIGRLMDNSGRRLDLTRPGDKTQDIQKKIVFRLDELIKQMENQGGGGGGQANGGACPNGGKPGNQPGAGNQPNAPMPDSQLGGQSGDGVVIEKKLREFAETWGTLPPEKRATIIQEMARDVPAKYKPVVDEYFKALNRTYGFKDK